MPLTIFEPMLFMKSTTFSASSLVLTTQVTSSVSFCGSSYPAFKRGLLNIFVLMPPVTSKSCKFRKVSGKVLGAYTRWSLLKDTEMKCAWVA